MKTVYACLLVILCIFAFSSKPKPQWVDEGDDAFEVVEPSTEESPISIEVDDEPLLEVDSTPVDTPNPITLEPEQTLVYQTQNPVLTHDDEDEEENGTSSRPFSASTDALERRVAELEKTTRLLTVELDKIQQKVDPAPQAPVPTSGPTKPVVSNRVGCDPNCQCGVTGICTCGPNCPCTCVKAASGVAEANFTSSSQTQYYLRANGKLYHDTPQNRQALGFPQTNTNLNVQVYPSLQAASYVPTPVGSTTYVQTPYVTSSVQRIGPFGGVWTQSRSVPIYGNNTYMDCSGGTCRVRSYSSGW